MSDLTTAPNDLLAREAVRITHPDGLPLRSAYQVSVASAAFPGEIHIRCGTRCVNAKETLEMLTLNARPGSQLIVEVTGPNAAEMCWQLRCLLGDETR